MHFLHISKYQVQITNLIRVILRIFHILNNHMMIVFKGCQSLHRDIKQTTYHQQNIHLKNVNK